MRAIKLFPGAIPTTFDLKLQRGRCSGLERFYIGETNNFYSKNAPCC
jgi:hypothetical protein